MKKLCFFITILSAPVYLLAQGADAFKKINFTREGNTLPYRILYPKNYDKSKSYPVLTFLHGSGERGDNNEAQLTHGGKLFSNDSVRNTFNAIVIFPQCPRDSTWNYFRSKRDSASPGGRSIDFTLSPRPTTPAGLVKLLLDSLIASRAADPARMYIGGLSLGGFGTFDMIERYPDFFTAAIPICGGGDTSLANRFAKKIAVWIFHGDNDQSVHVQYSRQYYAALKNLGADVRYTEYPGVGHNSWDNAFAEKELLPWLISKTKTQNVNEPDTKNKRTKSRRYPRRTAGL